MVPRRKLHPLAGILRPQNRFLRRIELGTETQPTPLLFTRSRISRLAGSIEPEAADHPDLTPGRQAGAWRVAWVHTSTVGIPTLRSTNSQPTSRILNA
eukprot:COSAG02_NODE_3956_length_5986_cov_18.502633_5_plen_98_part_00